MTFTVTPHGVQAYIPIIEYSKKTYADLSWSGDASLSKLPNAEPSRFLLCLEKDPELRADIHEVRGHAWLRG